MRFVAVDRLVPGMILGRDVRDTGQRILLTKDKEITAGNIRRLEELGYTGAYILDDLSKDVELHETITQELRMSATTALKNQDVDKLRDVALEIVDQILNSSSTSLDMADLRAFDDYTFAHSVNVAVVAVVLGLGMGYVKEELVDLCQAGLFHDLGKLNIDPEILNKEGLLTPEEMRTMRRHPQMSYDLLAEHWNIPTRVRMGVLSHHENEDGSGYPMGLTGDKIHPFAKVIHIADVYDAISSRRPYKKAYSCAESLEYIMCGTGSMFDCNLVDAFIRNVPVFPKGTTVTLSNGKEAIVIENTAQYALRPRLRLMDGTDLDMLNDRSLLNVTIVADNGNELYSTKEIELLEDKRKSLLSGK